jgi:hypothetical protein
MLFPSVNFFLVPQNCVVAEAGWQQWLLEHKDRVGRTPSTKLLPASLRLCLVRSCSPQATRRTQPRSGLGMKTVSSMGTEGSEAIMSSLSGESQWSGKAIAWVGWVKQKWKGIWAVEPSLTDPRDREEGEGSRDWTRNWRFVRGQDTSPVGFPSCEI